MCGGSALAFASTGKDDPPNTSQPVRRSETKLNIVLGLEEHRKI
jgi:hypothetical protein